MNWFRVGVFIVVAVCFEAALAPNNANGAVDSATARHAAFHKGEGKKKGN